jgi:predicted dehydrogenase
MAKVYRVGVACMSHDHVWGEIATWQKLPNVELVAAGDDEPHLLERFTQQTGITKVYNSWQELLEHEELDILQVAGGNSEGADIVEAAAAKGIHVISEKPMAATLSQANRMYNAAVNAGIKLLINWPTAWSPAWQELAKRALAGEIGTIHNTRYRSAHNGPIAIGCEKSFIRDLTTPEINGAGAFMDYCCYGADLAALLLGLPNSVTGMRGYFGTEPGYAASDDNGMIIAKYDHAFGLCEASWTQPVGYAGNNPVVYGSEGALSILKSNVYLQKPGQPTEEIIPSELVYPYRNGPEHLLHCIETGAEIEGYCSPKVSRDAQEILEAGLRAADTGLTQVLPLDL